MDENHRTRLMTLLLAMRGEGARFLPLEQVDTMIDDRSPAVFLRHDVHDVNLNDVVRLAKDEHRAGIAGTFFFLPPEHPRARGAYDRNDLRAAVQELIGMGHQIGLHVDPRQLTEGFQTDLRTRLVEELTALGAGTERPRIANIHGDTSKPMRDLDGFNISFDFFEELGRQSDPPMFANVPQDLSRTLRQQRCSVRALGLTHWGDMPIWSSRFGFVVTDFITDNRLGKTGQLEFVVQPEVSGRYKLATRQPPGSRSVAKSDQEVLLVPGRDSLTSPGSHFARLGSERAIELSLRLVDRPLLMLIHPEFYI